MSMNKRKLCNHIIKKMELWRDASWAEPPAEQHEGGKALKSGL